jgi:hypothetical protein
MCPLNALGPPKKTIKNISFIIFIACNKSFSIFTKMFLNNLHNLSFILWGHHVLVYHFFYELLLTTTIYGPQCIYDIKNDHCCNISNGTLAIVKDGLNYLIP